jgi:hypothetical protein
MKVLKIFIGVVSILLMLNYTPLVHFLKEDYTYQNFDRSFIITEENGFDYEVVKLRYQRFLSKNPIKARLNNSLYRNFKMRPWYIWEWSDYIFQHERFSLPYKEP